jgi:outer membrane protein OmpA-like peptidoglycan-associated protein
MPDGRHVIFVSNRDLNNGLDIFITGKDRGDKWQTSSKIKGVNTPLNEYSVIIHPDNETVYFSSNGRSGSGGYDLYGARMIRKKSGFAFSNITNIREINTYRNELRPPLITMDVKTMFFNFKKTGRNFLYRGNIAFSPRPSLFTDIFVFDKKTKVPLETKIKLFESSAAKRTYIKDTDKNGHAGFMLQRNKKYFVSLASKNYIYMSKSLMTGSKPLFMKKRYYLSKGMIKKGYSFTAENIYFDTGSSVIREESFNGLERVYDFMIKNPGIKVKISGNTDNVGTYDYNMRLSLERANSIVKYLTQKGISRSRMVARGLGFLKSIAPNTTDSGRQKNRRVDITVILSK